MSVIHYNPQKDEPVAVVVDLTSDVYAFDVPSCSFNIQITSEGIIADFVSTETGGVITTFALEYGDILESLLRRDSEKMAAVLRHPASLHIDGGGK